jgi:hypothetical protein
MGGGEPLWGVHVHVCGSATGLSADKTTDEYLKRRVYNENEKTQQKKRCTATAHPEVPSRQPPHCAVRTHRHAANRREVAAPRHTGGPSRAALAGRRGGPPAPAHTHAHKNSRRGNLN